MPLTTAIHSGCVQSNRELALESQKQANAIAMQRERQAEDIRTSYLERLKVPGEHLRTLRFVIATTNDNTLRAWAVQEKKVVEEELHKLDDAIKQAEETAEKADTRSDVAVVRFKGNAARAVKAQMHASNDEKDKLLQEKRPEEALREIQLRLEDRKRVELNDDQIKQAEKAVRMLKEEKELQKERKKAESAPP